MESVLEDITLMTVIVASLVAVIGAVWAAADALATRSEAFKQARRHKWAWVVSSLLIVWVGVYYVCVVRHEIKGTSFPSWMGHLATAFGSFMALVTFIAIATDVNTVAVAAALWLPTAVSMYLGVNDDKWTESAPAPARQRRTQLSPIAH
jgi:cytochrome bd-type quinol oxidase subunit 2